jgi:hypothetical protein
MPNERLPVRGFSAEYFPQFHDFGQPHELLLAIVRPRKNPVAAAWALSC